MAEGGGVVGSIKNRTKEEKGPGVFSFFGIVWEVRACLV